jgi:molybdopterin-guanine dinucleotide biosynthesis protein A
LADRRLTGILLVGGASSRFGSPKALARFEAETLAERAWRLLGEACEERIAVGDGTGLPFPTLGDEGTGPVAAIAVGLRHATLDVAVVVPVDMPLLTPDALGVLADACRGAATAQAGPLPCAVARRMLPAFETSERRLRTILDGLDTTRVELDDRLLANVNEPDDLRRLAASATSAAARSSWRSRLAP